MSPLGSEVITTSASVAAAAPLSKTCAPLSAAASLSAGTGSKPRTVWPAARRLAAIGPPMWPNSRNAIVVIDSSLSTGLCGRAGAGRFGPTDDHAHDFVGALQDSVHP